MREFERFLIADGFDCINQKLLDTMTTEIGSSQVIAYCPGLLDGKVRGRTVVDVNR
ncbi:MAG: hypothetical protein ACOH2B_03710 [Burkholderiaceae bacterium]